MNGWVYGWRLYSLVHEFKRSRESKGAPRANRIVHFYGKRIDPATEEVAQAFGVAAPPQRLQTGQKTAYSAGNIVLKPAESEAVTVWLAELFDHLLQNSS